MAPELRSDMVSALLLFEWIKTWTVIDFSSGYVYIGIARPN